MSSLSKENDEEAGRGYVARCGGHVNRETVKQVAFLGGHTGTWMLLFPSVASEVDCVTCLERQGMYVASGSDDGSVFLWDALTGYQHNSTHI